MHVTRPVLNLYLADRMLYEFFRQDKKTDLQELRAFVEKSVDNDIARRKMLMRIVKQETNRTLIAMVIHCLPEEYKRLLLLHYKWHASYTKQTLMLNVSRSQLGYWREDIRKQVYHALHYHLLECDIFQHMKIVNMLEVLGTLVIAKEQLDPMYEIIDEHWFRSIVQYYDQYSELLQRINDCCVFAHKTLENRVISAIVRSPHQRIGELAREVNQTESIVSRTLRSFRNDVRNLVFKP
mgnify:CR=1 FL=1